jgi:hypothetical protein
VHYKTSNEERKTAKHPTQNCSTKYKKRIAKAE